MVNNFSYFYSKNSNNPLVAASQMSIVFSVFYDDKLNIFGFGLVIYILFFLFSDIFTDVKLTQVITQR